MGFLLLLADEVASIGGDVAVDDVAHVELVEAGELNGELGTPPCSI